MPALSTTSLLNGLSARAQAEDPSDALQVVCAWPVSGQYGPGSRVLYYVLVAACVLARKTVWLRKACLAAALLLPAVAALHALVLCSMHINGVVDMDIYGAFQLCSIGILAAPLAVQSSKTYFYDPRRNIIFLWTGLILAGLLALAVEFYRVTPADCTLNGVKFLYETADVLCNIQCSPENGPRSPLRDGPNNNIGVIPIPYVLTYNAAMLLATACCIPAIIALVFTFDKILDIHWKRSRDEPQRMNELIEGANGATVGQMRGVNGMVRKLLSVIYIPLFGGAVLAILVVGEVNFFSPPVLSQTEPITSVGQWGPIAGTALAAVGSLYLLLTDKWEDDQETRIVQQAQQMQRQPTIDIQPDDDGYPFHASIDGRGSGTLPRSSHESGLGITMTEGQSQRRSSPTADPGGRRKVAQMLQKAGDYLGAAAHNKFDATAYNRSAAREFPEIPGEAHRNPELEELKRQYSRRREEALREERSRASSPGSPAASASSFVGFEGTASASASPPVDGTPQPESTRGRPPARRDTLEVPSPAFHRP